MQASLTIGAGRAVSVSVVPYERMAGHRVELGVAGSTYHLADEERRTLIAFLQSIPDNEVGG